MTLPLATFCLGAALGLVIGVSSLGLYMATRFAKLLGMTWTEALRGLFGE